MRKIAIFVEGYTEVVFISNLIEEIAGRHNVLIETQKIIGGKSVPRSILKITAAREVTNQKYFVLICDCGGDQQVKTRIQEEHENLSSSGYEFVIGIRDVYPRFTLTDIPKLEQGLKKYIKTSLIPVHFVLGVMEVEAWFLAEHTHFQKVSSLITVPHIAASLGFDPSNDDMTVRPKPAQDLNACYALGNLSYEKGGDTKTMEALDYARTYVELGDQIPSLGLLNSHLDVFLAA